MPKLTIELAVILLILGNIAAVFSDVFIKDLPLDTAIYQFVLFRQLTAVLLLLPFCLFNKKRRLFNGVKWHFIRAHIWLLGAVCMVISLTGLPLATVNAIFYTAPLLMLPLGIILYKDKFCLNSLIAATVGFIGVLIIVKPTQINVAALAALGVALSIAINHLLVRKLPSHHNVFQTLLLTNLVGIPTVIGLTLWENKPWDWQPLITAAVSNIFILIYAGICVLVYRAVEANKVSSAEYTGLLSAVAAGIFWFDEIPDFSLAIGAILIITPIIWLTKTEAKKKRKKDLINNVHL